MSDVFVYQGELVTLFNGQAVNGSSPVFEYMHGTKMMNIYVSGDFGGGTLTLEAISPNNVTFVPVKSITINGAGMYSLQAFPFRARVTLAGATNPLLSVYVQGAVRLDV